MRTWIATLLIFLGAMAGHAASGTKVSVVFDVETARPGDTVLAGVEIKLVPGWHTYWRYSGDSGLAPKVQWTLPAGVTAGEIQWPIPAKTVESAGKDTLTTYAYEDEVVLLVPLKIGPDVAVGAVNLTAKVNWLECQKECLPQTKSVSSTLKIGPARTPSADSEKLAPWQKRLPQIGSDIKATAHWEKPVGDKERVVVIEWTTATANADFFPYDPEGFEIQNATEQTKAAAGTIVLKKTIKKGDAGWPGSLRGLLVSNPGQPDAAGYEVNLTLSGNDGGATTTPTPASTAATTGDAQSVGVMLCFAFLGGLILNIMPCVLPVIALKILGFVNQSRQSPGRVRMLGLIYGAGVLASFLVLALLVVGVQSAGQKASWGMQFSNPKFLVILTTLVTLVALNLFGLFEVTPGGAVTGAAGDLAAKEGASGAFFNGVLATILATPCTAPFLGSALAFAFTQPSSVIVLIFLTAGVGLAVPYVVLSFQPGWLKFLPRPGAWMEKFKIAMGFPMLATAIWLFTVTAEFYSDVVWLGLFLVLAAGAAWVYGEFFQRGRVRRGLALGISASLLVIGYGYGLERQLHWRTPPPPRINGSGDEIIQDGPDGIEWHRWSPQAVAQARAAGRPVFVDFTAKWCVTCIVNKLSSIEVDAVRARLKAINALSFLADYTRRPEDMTKEILSHGRSGVPLVLVYPKDPAAAPIVLPDGYLTPGIVLEALEKAGK